MEEIQIVDWEAICAQLIAENETLRASLTRERLAQLSMRFKAMTRQDVAEMVRDKKYWFGVAAGLILAISFGIAPFFVDILRRISRE